MGNNCVSKGGYYHTLPDINRGIVTFMRVDKVDMKAIATKINDDDLVEAYIYLNESIYQTLDHITRTTGRLTKQLKVIDFEGANLKHINMKFIKKDSTVNKKLEDFYPQMLGMLVIVNSPSWFAKLFRTIRPLFPIRVIEKVDILPTKDKMKIKDLDRLFRYISKNILPEKYGGLNYKWPLPEASLIIKKI